tara:strand:+ start:154 stop:408 length:255 start_codon:yes stop_codon:yes gene_type:complete
MMPQKKLDDKEYIFAMLATLVKREGGEIRLSEDEIAAVSKEDIIALMYDTRTGEIVLRLKEHKATITDLLSSAIAKSKGDKYEN